MNKKIIMAMIVGVFVIGIVTAIQVGGLITQTQFDNFDIDSMDLGESFVKQNGNLVYDCNPGTCDVYVTLLTAQRVYPGTHDESIEYEIIEVTREVSIDVPYYKGLRDDNNITYARSELKDYLVSDRNRIASQYKQVLKSWQTEEEDDISDLIDGLQL